MEGALQESAMFIYSKRLETLKGWPFTVKEGCKCTAEKLAQSGFFRPKPEQEPELARCFMCHKDLEGWDENDDPELEHKAHSPKCPFLCIKNRDVMKMKLRDYVKLKYIEECQLIIHQTKTTTKEMEKKIETSLSKQINLQTSKT